MMVLAERLLPATAYDFNSSPCLRVFPIACSPSAVDEKVDIFAAGCVLYQLHTMEAPGPKSKEVVPSVEDTTFCQPASPTARFPLAGAEAEGFLDRHCRFWNAFVAMVCPTAAGRPTAAQLLKYDFFFGSEEDDGEFSFCRCAKCREWLTC